MTLLYVILALVVVGAVVYLLTKKKGPTLPGRPEAGPGAPPSPPPPPAM